MNKLYYCVETTVAQRFKGFTLWACLKIDTQGVNFLNIHELTEYS